MKIYIPPPSKLSARHASKSVPADVSNDLRLHQLLEAADTRPPTTQEWLELAVLLPACSDQAEAVLRLYFNLLSEQRRVDIYP